MNKVIIIALLFISSIGFSQENETTFEKAGDLVKATYYYDNGDVKVEGFFKNKKLAGVWTSFDTNGNKTKIAQYEAGNKVGKWLILGKESLKEINYNNNLIVSVNELKSNSRLALNNE